MIGSPPAAIEPLACYRESWSRIRSDYWLFLGITAVGLILGGVAPLGILLGPMQCGIYLCYLQKWRGQAVRFETLFRGFDYFLESLIAALILMGVGFVVFLPCALAGIFGTMLLIGVGAATQRPGYVALAALLGLAGYVLLILLASLIGSFFTFTFILIVDRRLTAIEAVRRSADAVWRHLGGVFALSLLSAALSLAGLCLCYVGAFLIAPISLGAIVAAYGRVFGFEANPATGDLAPAGQ